MRKDTNIQFELINRQEENVYDANEKACCFAGITHDRTPEGERRRAKE